MPPAGTMDRRVTILRENETGVDELNAPIVEWQPLRTIWASKTHKSEGEGFDEETKQRASYFIVSFRMRWSDDIEVTDRLECESVQYNITGIRELGRRDGLEVTAEARR